MLFVFLNAYWNLILFDLYLARGDFNVLYKKVRGCHLGQQSASPQDVDHICSAVDLACVWYWKEVLCLQRSAAAACLLRKHGIAADLVLGAQQFPFKAHAWVEVDGQVVIDKPYVRDIYAVLDRC
jgi:Transglutaminase-like superfamily